MFSSTNLLCWMETKRIPFKTLFLFLHFLARDERKSTWKGGIPLSHCKATPATRVYRCAKTLESPCGCWWRSLERSENLWLCKNQLILMYIPGFVTSTGRGKIHLYECEREPLSYGLWRRSRIFFLVVHEGHFLSRPYTLYYSTTIILSDKIGDDDPKYTNREKALFPSYQLSCSRSCLQPCQCRASFAC